MNVAFLRGSYGRTLNIITRAMLTIKRKTYYHKL